MYDIIKISNIHREQAGRIYMEIKDMKNKVISIYGIPGVGKTETAVVLSEILHNAGINSFVVSMDSWYVSHFKNRELFRRISGIIGKEEIDWELLSETINEFKNNELMTFRRVNIFAGEIETCVIDSSNIDFLIVEGLYTGYLKKLGLCDYAVFIKGNLEDTHSFRKLRGKENPDNEFRKKILKKEVQSVNELECYADKIINFYSDWRKD